MFVYDIGDRLFSHGQNVEPVKHGPQPVFFPHVVRACAEGFFTTQRDPAGIEQVAKKFPAGGCLKALDAQRGGNAIDGLAGRHRACDPGKTLCVGRYMVGIGGEQGQAVAGCDIKVPAKNHVAVAVAVRCGTEVGRIVAAHRRHQFFRVYQIRIGMRAAEIRQRLTTQYRAGRCAQPVLQNLFRIGAGDCIHRIEAHAERARGEQFAHRIEIEQLLHQFGVISDRIENIDDHVTESLLTDKVEIDVIGVRDPVLGDLTAPIEDGLGDSFRCRTAVGGVVLDAEVV